MVTWVLYLCMGVVIGGVAGFYFAKLDDFSKKQKRALEEKLKTSEAELMDYKQQVTHHFKETAALVNNMTESYQKVHEHLAIGAGTLCNNEVEVDRIKVTHHNHREKALASNKHNNLLPEANSSTDVEAPKTIAGQESSLSEPAFDSVKQASDAAPTPAEPESDNKIKTNTAVGKNPQKKNLRSGDTAASATPPTAENIVSNDHTPPPEGNQPETNKQNENNALDKHSKQSNSPSMNTAESISSENRVTETMAVVDDDSTKHEPESVTVAEPPNAAVSGEAKPNTSNPTVH